MEQFMKYLTVINDFLWGAPLLVILVGTGIYLTIRLRGMQISKLPMSLKSIFDKGESDSKSEQGDVSSFAALCTALAATIGTGNIVGVAIAIKTGGPGALFWMWMAALFGMATKYAEGFLAIKYRVKDENGEMSGGPMYYIERGINNKILAKMFAVFGIIAASLGIGSLTQVDSIASVVNVNLGVPVPITVVIIMVLVALVILRGIKSVSKVAEKLVPFMATLYVLGALTIIITNIDKLPGTISLIIKSAFTPMAASGGFLGSTIILAIRSGVSRGVFSNEAGLGSAPIAAAAAKTKSAVKQGLVCMTGTFFDTVVICSFTGIVLVITGAWNTKGIEGAAITSLAFQKGLPFPSVVGSFIITLGLVLFAFTTILGWNYYGERCVVYLFGVKGIKLYKIIFILLIGLVAIPSFDLHVIWKIADISNALMALPNLIAIIGLSGIIVNETRKYFKEINDNNLIEEDIEEVIS
ncbi:sodium:alanine symporter family protein [Clostridium oceanicum]|uniref:Sodium:alanine symporter family protein n=1 Tax=Clostridium oceanicum TaxID=1543 RepID=A0ABN1JAL0_9CLOT